MTTMQELHELSDSIDKFIKRYDERHAELDKAICEIHLKANRPNLHGTGPSIQKAVTTMFDTKSKREIPVLEHNQSLKSFDKKSGSVSGFDNSEARPSMGRVLRGLVLGGRADDARELEEERKAMGMGSDPAGGYTVNGGLASEWIDLLRADMVLSKAGARTVPMDTGSLSLARVTGDPAISWHGENATITATDPTLGAVNLHAKTVVCLVKLSLELSQDSANIQDILQRTITSAMANAIDSAGLNGVTVDAGAAPSGVMDLANRNRVTAIGAPTTWDFLTDGMYELMADNVPMDQIGAFIAHPAVWKKMRKLKTGITNDNTPLTMPQEIAALPKLWSTAAPLTGGTTASGIIANWRDLLFGVRQDISVRVLQETFMGSNLQIAVLAYARVDFAATRYQSFCTLEGITV
jgi:HK97 family phage major capsid protein